MKDERNRMGAVSLAPQRAGVSSFAASLPTETASLALGFVLDAACLVHFARQRPPVQRLGERDGLTVKYRAQDVPRDLPRGVALCVYRVAQEALRNVAFHARCRRASVRLAAGGGELVLCVRDRGAGITAHERKAIFCKFVRGSAAAAGNVRGSGVGLAMVLHIVDAHRGEVHVNSEPGSGSTFTILLPAMEKACHASS